MGNAPLAYAWRRVRGGIPDPEGSSGSLLAIISVYLIIAG